MLAARRLLLHMDTGIFALLLMHCPDTATTLLLVCTV